MAYLPMQASEYNNTKITLFGLLLKWTPQEVYYYATEILA